MKTDRELLEFAAKAVGIEVYWHNSKRCYVSDPATPWNPLTDDGDALRLAVRLHFSIFQQTGSVTVYINGIDGETVEEVAYEADAATRRAIVRAAAEIGEGVK